MKRLLIYASALLLPAGLLFSCNNDKETGIPDNTFSINGDAYSFAGGGMEYYGDYYASSAENIDLYIGEDGPVGMSFEMFTSTGNTKLVSGTYAYNAESHAPFTFSDGYATDAIADYKVSGGTVVIAVSGTTYTITVNCTLEGGGTLTGKYVGTLEWSDETPEQLGTGTFSFNGHDYDFYNGVMEYRGDMYSPTADNIVLYIGTSGQTYMAFSMFTATGNTTLPGGTYTYAAASYTPLAISSGYVYDGTDEYDVTGGTVVAAVAGDTYTITVNCTISGGGTLTGEYTGTLLWSDDSDNSRSAAGMMRTSGNVISKVSLKK